ncbi:hypothetical protein IWQ62_004045 [Dispira parvispora]|uniref:Uncharacterized protein n=1 Tax=Dispira parvispora TaxID=1520584 RepID=A0A9W8AMD0_9FUNG|nr:hypothetical protein IWQ62_004045 [Dispira parvispora]
MSTLLISLGIIAGFPMLLRVASQFFSKISDKKNPNIRRREAFGTKDVVVYFLLAVTAVWQIYITFISPPTNIFRTLDVNLKTPQYLLRHRWQNYAAEQRASLGSKFYPVDQDFPTAFDKASPEFNRHHYSHTTLYGYLDTLVDRLQSRDSRYQYATYGEDAFMGCSWCENDSDRTTYIVPGIALRYLWMSLVVIVYSLCNTTFSPRRKNWQVYLLTLLGVLLLVDIWLFMVSPADRHEFLSLFGIGDSHSEKSAAMGGSVERTWFWADTSHRLRSDMFFLMCLALALLDFIQSGELTPQESLTVSTAQAQMALQRIKAVKSQQIAVLRDDDLRKIFLGHYTTEGILHRRAKKDSTFDRVYREAIGKHDYARLLSDAQEYVNQVLEAAFSSETPDSTANSP